MITEPLGQWHKVSVRETKIAIDGDNPNTPASLYKAFPPEQARRLIDRLEIHYNPQHGSW